MLYIYIVCLYHTHIYIHICIRIFLYFYMCIYIYIYIHIYIYIYIYQYVKLQFYTTLCGSGCTWPPFSAPRALPPPPINCNYTCYKLCIIICDYTYYKCIITCDCTCNNDYTCYNTSLQQWMQLASLARAASTSFSSCQRATTSMNCGKLFHRLHFCIMDCEFTYHESHHELRLYVS